MTLLTASPLSHSSGGFLIDCCCFSGISTASQGSFTSVKSSSGSRSGTSTWASPVTEAAAESSGSSPNTAWISSASAANHSPCPPPRATNPGQVKSSTEKQCFDQSRLEPTPEEPPDSPCVMVMTSSCKRR